MGFERSQFMRGNILLEVEDGYYMNHCKEGNLSCLRASFHQNALTVLNECGCCGKISTPKKVHERSVRSWRYSEKELKDGDVDFDTFIESIKKDSMLCTGCWNKVKAIEKREDEAQEIKRLTNKLKAEVSKCRKLERQVI